MRHGGNDGFLHGAARLVEIAQAGTHGEAGRLELRGKLHSRRHPRRYVMGFSREETVFGNCSPRIQPQRIFSIQLDIWFSLAILIISANTSSYKLLVRPIYSATRFLYIMNKTR